MIDNINWYPGHMKKTRELIQTNLKLVDVVIELIDARIPISSRNPIIDEIVSKKPRVVVLNKSDLANAKITQSWLEYFKNEGNMTISLNASTGQGVSNLLKLLEKFQDEKNLESAEKNSNANLPALKKQIRLMIVGIPNVGKSSLINSLMGRKAAMTGDKPGITKGKQWLTLKNGMQLLDTPGILWPKFESPEVGLNLAFCGSIKDETMNTSDLGLELIKKLRSDYPDELITRYKLVQLSDTALEDMENMAIKRGFILKGNRIDYERMGRNVLDEFRAGKLGRISLERVGEL
ncbi:MAG: ribosome biogenesis GTPase YlqF [Eubacteriales bacterium]